MSTEAENAFKEVSSPKQIEEGQERWLRQVDDRCWISVLFRRTGFGWYEWETAIVILIEPGSRPKKWESDDRDCLIIAGDRREELATMPKEKLREWYGANINGNRNSMETLMETVRSQMKEP